MMIESNSAGRESQLRRYPALLQAYGWSVARVEQIRDCLSDLRDRHREIRTLVLAGSLARLDAGPHSDGDLIVVIDDGIDLGSERSNQLMDAVWDRLEALGLRRPYGGGIFVTPTSRRQLCDGPRGIVDEAVAVFGKRMTLLLEARPVYGAENCRRLQSDIVARYANHPFAVRPGERWRYLLDDLIRYWRSYRVWQSWNFASEDEGWHIANLKLRHSRLLTYTGLLLTCLTDPQNESAVDFLSSRLPLTPLERLDEVKRTVGTGAMDGIYQSYDRFLGVLQDATQREQLLTATPIDSPHDAPSLPPLFNQLMDNADQLRGELVQMTMELTGTNGCSIVAEAVF